MCQKAYLATAILEMRKNFGNLCKKYSINLIDRDSGGLCFKKNPLIFTVICQKSCLFIWYFNWSPIIASCAPNVTQSELFLTRILQSLYQIDWTRLSKIFTHFWQWGSRVCFLEHPIISLIIIVRQNYFY